MEKTKNDIEYKIDFSEIKFDESTAKKILYKLKWIRKKADFLGKSLNVIMLNSKQYEIEKITNQYEYYIYVAIEAVKIDNKNERYEYLYDKICYYLDKACRMNNLCEFKNDKCFVKKDTDVTMGCCHHFPNKFWGMFYQKKMIPCEYLGKTGCTTKAIGCKMFMCDEINKKGYKFTVYNVLLIRYFFNGIQKVIIITGIFDMKENIMKRLLRFC